MGQLRLKCKSLADGPHAAEGGRSNEKQNWEMNRRRHCSNNNTEKMDKEYGTRSEENKFSSIYIYITIYSCTQTLLSSMTVLSDSIHIGSMSPSKTIHLGPSWPSEVSSLMVDENRPESEKKHSISTVFSPYSFLI